MSNIKSTRVRKRESLDLVEEVLEEDRGPIGPIGEDGLTDRQRAFVTAFSDGPTAGIGTKSAIVAGYSEKSAPTIAANLQKLPHVAAAIDVWIRNKITQPMTARAVQLLGTVMDDETQPVKLRALIALKVADSSGVFQRAQVEKAKETGLTSDKNLLDMSRDELETLVRQGAAVLKAAAALPPPGPVLEGRLLGDGAQDRAQPDEPETE